VLRTAALHNILSLAYREWITQCPAGNHVLHCTQLWVASSTRYSYTFSLITDVLGDPQHRATNRKVAGSIPDEVIQFSNSPNPSSRTMALRLTQPLTEMSTQNLPGGGGGVRDALPPRKADNLTAICLLIF
jgi:hypothetical protein